MALILMEGFDHFTSDAHAVDKGWTGMSSQHDIHTNYGRFGGQGVQNTYSGVVGPRKDIGVNKATLYFGTAIKKVESDDPGGKGDRGIISLLDDSSVIQVGLWLGTSYELLVYRGDDTLLGSSADYVIPNQKWFYLEGKVTISDTVGVVEIRVNEVEVINETGLDTKNGSDYIRWFNFCGIYHDIGTYFDDIYVDDAQFHGDCRVRAFLPDSISSTNNSFTASAGNKDECVDDNPPTDDTDYIYSDTLNHKQGFGITTGTLGTVIGIQLNNFCRIDEAGTRQITPLIRSNGSDYLGTETENIAADYNFESEIWETDPDDVAAWTQTKLEAAEFGLEITT
jgi:hypothetical protein